MRSTSIVKMPFPPRFDDPSAWDWPLPSEPYLPGRTPRPSDDDDVHRISRTASPSTTSDRWSSNPAYLAGLRLYANGYYWEAHEAWEPVWMAAGQNTQERRLMQGVIQLANACLKVRMGQPVAAARLSVMAADHIREATYGPARVVMGLEVADLLDSVERFARGLRTAPQDPPELRPLT